MRSTNEEERGFQTDHASHDLVPIDVYLAACIDEIEIVPDSSLGVRLEIELKEREIRESIGARTEKVALKYAPRASLRTSDIYYSGDAFASLCERSYHSKITARTHLDSIVALQVCT